MKRNRFFIILFVIFINICNNVFAKDATKNDIFEDHFRLMEKEMKMFEEMMNERMKFFKKIENDCCKEIESEYSSKIQQQIEKDETVYCIYFKGFDKDEVQIKIKKGELIFQAEKEIKTEEDNMKINSVKNFYYKFSIPKKIKEKDLKILKEDGKITVSFKNI